MTKAEMSSSPFDEGCPTGGIFVISELSDRVAASGILPAPQAQEEIPLNGLGSLRVCIEWRYTRPDPRTKKEEIETTVLV